MATNPWEINWSQPQGGGGLEAVPLPKQPPAQTPNQAALDAVNLQLKQKELGKNGAAALTSEDRGKFVRQRQGALGLKQRINEIEQLYTDAFRGAGGDTVNPATGERTITKPGLGSAAEYLPGRTPIIGRPVNEVFKNASGALMGDLAAAYGLTAQQQNTPVELEIRFGPFIPKPGDPDQVIEKKIARLHEIAAEQERQALDALGELPAQQQINGPAPAQTVPVPANPELPPVTPSQGGTQSVVDPRRQQIAGEIGSLIAKGADRNVIMGRAVGMDPSLRGDPRFRAAVDQALQFRASPDWAKWQRLNKGKAYPVDPSFYTREEQLTPPEQLLNEAAQSPGGAYAAGAADTLTGGTLDELIGALGGNADTARQSQQMISAENPTASFLGNLTGGTLAALGGEAALSRLGMAPGAGRALLADTGFGAGYGAGSADDGSRLSGAALGAATGAGGNLLGRGITSGLGRVTAGVSDPAVQALVKENIPVTLGQAVGKAGPVGRMIKGAEDRLSGLPIVGDAISARRVEGIEAMNAKAFDKALEPINKTVGNISGEEAVDKAQGLVGNAFNDALRGKAAAVDRPFITEAASAKRAIQALPRVGGEVESSIDEVVNSYFDPSGNISGENMQALLRDLGAIKRGYQNDPLGHRVGKAVGMVEKSVENLFRRQAPDVMPQYDAAKQAFRRLSIVEDAVLRGKNTGGKFTPGQLGMADRANAKKYSGSHAAAAGKGEFHDFQRNAQDVLPNQVPDSGTAGRLLLPLGLVGGAGVGAAGGDAQGGATTGLTLAGLLALAYSKQGQRALVGAVAKRGPRSQAAGKFIKDRARLIGSVGATGAVLGTSPDQ